MTITCQHCGYEADGLLDYEQHARDFHDQPVGNRRRGHTAATNHVGFVNGCPDCMRVARHDQERSVAAR